MTPREERASVLFPVRIRDDDHWSDGRIRNVSSRGLMLEMETPPPRGSFIEIRRGDIVIVGQVRWSSGGRCGLRTQDRVPVDRLGHHNAEPRHTSDAEAVERRVQVRVMTPQEIAERSRSRARLFQSLSLVIVGATGAVFFAMLMYDVLHRAFSAIAENLR